MPTCLTQEPADAAHSLVDALLIRHHGKTYKLIAILAKANARTDGNLGFLQQLLREFQGSHPAVLFRNRGPHKHGGFGLLDHPTSAVQSVTEHVTATPVHLDDFLDTLLWATQGCNRSNLDGLERPIIQVTLHARQCVDHFAISDAKAHAPARHAVALR